jgi:hypothetical protein
MFNNSKWQSAGTISNNLHPELLKLAAEIGVTPSRANGRNQAHFNGVWVGFYAGPWGSSPWQVGNDRVCMSRESVIALLTKGEEPAVTSPSLRNFTEVAKAKAEAPKPVAAPVAALVAPVVVETAAMKIARLTAAVEAKKAAEAASAVTAEEAAIIAQLEAMLAE